MNIRLIVGLVVGILAAHALLIHLLLRTSSLATERQDQKQKLEEISQDSSDDDDPDDPGDPGSDLQLPAGGNSIADDPFAAPPAGMKIPELDYRCAVRGMIPGFKRASHPATGILVDLNTGNVLWEKNSSSTCLIASMSKIMTLLLAYETAADSTVCPKALETPVPVTREAAAVPPSKVNLVPGEVFTLRELMIAASVKSANDAAYQIAQFCGGGKVDVFVAKMNERAKKLGMKDTVFFNPNGLPGKSKKFDNHSTAADMIRLCIAYQSIPLLREWAQLRAAGFRAPGSKNYVRMINHNNLLPGAKYGADGVTGIKTGFTSRAGFCLALTCSRNGRSLMAIVTGFPDVKGRDVFARSLLDWGFRRAAELK